MAADINDNFTQATNGTRPVPTTLTATLPSGSSPGTATIGAATGWPTATAVHFIIYTTDVNGNKVANSQTDWKGIVSGSSITGLTLKAGTNTGYSIGAIVEAAPTAAWANDMVAGATAEHNQDGTHSDVTADSVTVAGTTESDEVTVKGENIRTGWFEADEAWSYDGWTAGTRIATITIPSDGTTKYTAGMRVKFTQTTDGVKYGIIVKVESTLLTVFLPDGTDFDNETITVPFYSMVKAPFGFPMNKNLWELEFTSTSTAAVSTSWNNAGSLLLAIPVGVWDIFGNAAASCSRTGTHNIALALSESTSAITAGYEDTVVWNRGVTEGGVSLNARTRKNFTATTTVYILNSGVFTSGNLNVQYAGNHIIRATCAYL